MIPGYLVYYYIMSKAVICCDGYLYRQPAACTWLSYTLRSRLSCVGPGMSPRAAISSMRVEISRKVGNDWQTVYQQAHSTIHYLPVSCFSCTCIYTSSRGNSSSSPVCKSTLTHVFRTPASLCLKHRGLSLSHPEEVVTGGLMWDVTPSYLHSTSWLSSPHMIQHPSPSHCLVLIHNLYDVSHNKGHCRWDNGLLCDLL